VAFTGHSTYAVTCDFATNVLTVLRSGLLGGHNSDEIKPRVHWCRNSTIECACSARALSCNGATVSMETTQVVLDPLSHFSATIRRQMNNDPLAQQSFATDLFGEVVPEWYGILEFNIPLDTV